MLFEDSGKIFNFIVKYYDLFEKGYSGNYMCFVRFGIRLSIVCSGMGFIKEYVYEKVV